MNSKDSGFTTQIGIVSKESSPIELVPNRNNSVQKTPAFDMQHPATNNRHIDSSRNPLDISGQISAKRELELLAQNTSCEQMSDLSHLQTEFSKVQDDILGTINQIQTLADDGKNSAGIAPKIKKNSSNTES